MKMTIISVVPTNMEVSAGKFLNEVYCKDENGLRGFSPSRTAARTLGYV